MFDRGAEFRIRIAQNNGLFFSGELKSAGIFSKPCKYLEFIFER